MTIEQERPPEGPLTRDEAFEKRFREVIEPLGYHVESIGILSRDHTSWVYSALVIPQTERKEIIDQANTAMRSARISFPWSSKEDFEPIDHIPWEVLVNHPEYVHSHSSRQTALLAASKRFRREI